MKIYHQIGVSREPIGINDEEDYQLSTEVWHELYVDQNTGQIIQIGDTQAEMFQIIVVYDDGKEGVAARTFIYEVGQHGESSLSFHARACMPKLFVERQIP